ncbi:hypothetical protein, partial [Rhodopseudomonas sp. B29]|uniref:hypothetical protein n=1 Tax=Rhodopseudomonas sp. B29 TaxID=95607 RepID=UPI000594C857
RALEATDVQNKSVLGTGHLQASKLADWEQVTIRLGSNAGSREVEVTFSVEAGDVGAPIGLALYASDTSESNAAVIDGRQRDDSGRVGFVVRYAN